jgi:PPK2 family polyphosphate:nucleotide phosphotransferase
MQIDRYRAAGGGRFRLRDCDPASTDGIRSKQKARAALQADNVRLRRLQEKLYAQDRWALLVLLQGMDAAGKDSTVRHVMSGVNPQGCEVHAFRTPTEEELDHDFLWRTSLRLPRRGHIGIFNRSYYEEVLVVRVRPELLERQKLPDALRGRRLWSERFEDINAHERYLTRNGIVIRKIFLHVSAEEQRRRLLERLERREKQWKFSMHDVEERTRWKAYQRAYDEAIRSTSTRHAPWFVVPADNKWFARLVVGRIIVEALESLDLRFPTVSAGRRVELARVRRALEAEA